MTCLKPALPASGNVQVLLTLPQALPAQELLEPEHAVIDTQALLRRELAGADVAASFGHALNRRDAGATEYASWLPDPGALEIASWASNRRSAVR